MNEINFINNEEVYQMIKKTGFLNHESKALFLIAPSFKLEQWEKEIKSLFCLLIMQMLLIVKKQKEHKH